MRNRRHAKWWLVIRTLIAEVVVPFLSVTAGINVLPRNRFNLGIRILLEHRKGKAKSALAQILWLILVLQLACQDMLATSVAILWTKSRIIIAADSQFTSPRDAHLPSDCKIYVIDGYAFASAGTLSYIGPGIDFNANELIASAIKHADSVPKAADLAARVISRNLRNIALDMSQNNPKSYTSFRHGRSGFAIVGMKSRQQTVVSIRAFSHNPAGKLTAKADVMVSNEISGSAFLGTSTIGKRYIKSHHDWKSEDFAKLARRLVEMAAKDSPNDTGGAVSVLKIDSTGTKWVEEGCCNHKCQPTARP